MGQSDQDKGATFGKYRIVRKVGEGAFGVVYEAVLPGPMGFSKRVAIKRIHTHLVSEDPKFVQSMVNEARIGGLLHHPNVVDILEFGQVEDHWYLAMEFVDGIALSEVIPLCRWRGVLLPRFAVVDLALQVCRGLQYAHGFQDASGQSLHLVHRDIKPSNVILDVSGTAKVCDFGIAKATTNLYMTTLSAGIKGTPRYMSPEQITSEGELDPRSDVFSLGALLFEAMTGDVLFAGNGLTNLMQAILYDDLSERFELAEELFPGSRSVLAKALARPREDRYPDAMAMAHDLRGLGRAYPADAEMSEVVRYLVAAVGREKLPEIQDTGELRMGESTAPVMRRIVPVDPEPTRPSRLRPPPSEGSGWGEFTAAFFAMPEEEAPEETVAVMPVRPPAAGEEIEEIEDVEEIYGRQPSALRWLVPLVVLACGLLIALVVLIARPWSGPADSRGSGGVSPVSSGAEIGGDAGVASRSESEAGSELGVHREIDLEEGVEPGTERRSAPAAKAPPAAADRGPAPAAEPSELRSEKEVRGDSSAKEVRGDPSDMESQRELAAGTLSLSVRPWADIYVDGVKVTSGNALRAHAVDGGVHRIKAVCSALEFRTQEFTVTVDGEGVMLGCWDFESMAACERNR